MYIFIQSIWIISLSHSLPPAPPSGPSDLHNFMFPFHFVVNVVQSLIIFCHCDLIRIKYCHGPLPWKHQIHCTWGSDVILLEQSLPLLICVYSTYLCYFINKCCDYTFSCFLVEHSLRYSSWYEFFLPLRHSNYLVFSDSSLH